MNTLTPIQEIFNQPTWHFWHLEQEYFIYVGIEGGDDSSEPRKMYLCKPKQQGSIYVPDYVLSLNCWQIKEVNNSDVREGIESLFLPKVNEYLASLGGGGDNDFPIDGSDLEQYNWVVENALSYNNGKVSLI